MPEGVAMSGDEWRGISQEEVWPRGARVLVPHGRARRQEDSTSLKLPFLQRMRYNTATRRDTARHGATATARHALGEADGAAQRTRGQKGWRRRDRDRARCSGIRRLAAARGCDGNEPAGMLPVDIV